MKTHDRLPHDLVAGRRFGLSVLAGNGRQDCDNHPHAEDDFSPKPVGSKDVAREKGGNRGNGYQNYRKTDRYGPLTLQPAVWSLDPADGRLCDRFHCRPHRHEATRSVGNDYPQTVVGDVLMEGGRPKITGRVQRITWSTPALVAVARIRRIPRKATGAWCIGRNIPRSTGVPLFCHAASVLPFMGRRPTGLMG